MSRLDIAQLLNSLQNLFNRMAQRSLKSRIHAYQGKGGGAVDPDLSTSLSEHLDKLASQANTVDTKPSADERPDTQGPSKSKNGSRSRHGGPGIRYLREGLNGLSRVFKRRSSHVVLQPHLSDQLQRSVRKHLNTSLRKARQGDINNAKLHADLTCNAMHELARYMPKEEFTRFNDQISGDLKEFRDRDIFKPLTELSD